MKGQKRRMSAGYPPARPNNWPGGQYTNPNGVPQGYARLSDNSGSAGASGSGATEEGETAIGCNDGKINSPRGIPERTEPALCVGIRNEDDGIETESGNPGAGLQRTVSGGNQPEASRSAGRLPTVEPRASDRRERCIKGSIRRGAEEIPRIVGAIETGAI